MQCSDTSRPTRIQRWLAAVGRRQNQAMFDALVLANSSALMPHMTLSKMIAYGYATVVYLISLLLAAAGIGLIFIYGINLTLFLALGLLIVALGARPRLGKMPEKVVTRSEAPTLFQTLDAISAVLNTAPVFSVVVDEKFACSFQRVGFPRKTILSVGTPLWKILDREEQVAVLAHELAHGANGDAARGILVGSAIEGLKLWASVLRPRVSEVGETIALLAAPFLFFLYMLSEFTRLNAIFLYYLLWYDSRRAEYLADYLAATVVGTAATRSLLGKLHFSRSLDLLEALTMYSSPESKERKLARLRERIKAASIEDLEALNEPDEEEFARLDLTHPPIGYRMKFLAANPVLEKKVTLVPEVAQRIDEEIDAAFARLYPRLPSIYDSDFEYTPPKRR